MTQREIHPPPNPFIPRMLFSLGMAGLGWGGSREKIVCSVARRAGRKNKFCLEGTLCLQRDQLKKQKRGKSRDVPAASSQGHWIHSFFSDIQPVVQD